MYTNVYAYVHMCIPIFIYIYKKNRGSSGEGIWNTKRQPGSSCISPDVVAFTHAKGTQCRVAMFNIGFMSAFQLRGIKQNRGS